MPKAYGKSKPSLSRPTPKKVPNSGRYGRKKKGK